MKDKDVIFIAGYPGAGKGTICQEYCIHHPDVYHISAGDLIRDVIKEKSKSDFRHALLTTGDKETTTSPAWVISGIMAEKISMEYHQVYLLDGFPQRQEELDLFASNQNIHIIGSIFFDATISNCVNRMIKRGMRDIELFDKKLSEPEQNAYYQNRYVRYSANVPNISNLLSPLGMQKIDANKAISDVYQQFTSIISQFNQRRK